MGVMDFAGALVVHLSAGFSALALVLVAGRRRAASAGHAPVLGIAGGLLLWIGWAGILGGWSFGATDNAATAILNGHFAACAGLFGWMLRSEEHTSELQSLMRISYAVFCLKKKKNIELSKVEQRLTRQ